jgi:hypothetical protein
VAESLRAATPDDDARLLTLGLAVQQAGAGILTAVQTRMRSKTRGSRRLRQLPALIGPDEIRVYQAIAVILRPAGGQKDRYVMRSPKLLDRLRTWWRVERPTTWLLPGDSFGIAPMIAGIRSAPGGSRPRSAAGQS